MAKNEEVFIESSIRYWFTFADQIILFNHYSTDGTTAILEKLTAEFEERLTLFHPQFPIGIERNQEIFTNAMTEAAFRQYGMAYPDYRFFCTCRASRRVFGRELPNHQLQTVAARCGFDLRDHHHALADAEACAWIARLIL